MITISPTDSRFPVPTDTIIVTSPGDNPASENSIQSLRSDLLDPILAANTVTANDPLEIISLPSLRRILIISPTVELSSIIYKHAKSDQQLSNSFTFKFSRKNTKVEESHRHGSNNNKNNNKKNSSKYLELPEHKTIFLISPPTSPPPEFDYSRCEEEPSKETFALSDHLNSSSNGNSNSDSGSTSNSRVNLEYMIAVTSGKETEELEEKEITLIESKSGKITVSPCGGGGGGSSSGDSSNATVPRIVQTAMPPKSIFDDDDDDLPDDL